jgi:putative ABC transport system permease protein
MVGGVVKLRVVRRLLALFSKRRLERELDGEVLAHLELAERDAAAAGMSPEEARFAARRAFGGIEQMKEEHRDSRGIRWTETVLRDFRHGLASLGRDPGFAFVAVGVLALGIGANTAMFSLVDAALLRPLPFPEPERMVRVWEAPGENRINGINTLDLVDWKRLNTVFEALSAERGASVALTGTGEPARLAIQLVSADYFRVFGVSAQLGRTFNAGEDEPGAAPVVVLNHSTWQTRFGGDPKILGQEIILDGEPHRIVGVLPAGPFDRGNPRAWKPLIFKPEQMNRGFHWLGAVGRIKRGVTLRQARQEMIAIDKRLTDLSPAWKRDWSVAVEPFDQRLVGDNLRRAIYVAFGAVAMVLLIACANVANLLLAKGAARKKEMAVRAALGAGRGRLIGQLLTETVVLCLLGAAAGMGVAFALIRAAGPLLVQSLPFTAEVGLDFRVLAFTGAITLSVALLVGLLPSVQTSFGNLTQFMNQAARGSSGSRETLRRVIVVSEVAVSLVLICGALLLFRSLLQLQRVDTGVRISNVIAMSADLPLAAYPVPDNAVLFYQSVIERLEAIPGVEQAAVSTDLPLEGVRQGEGIGVAGREGGVGNRYKRVDARYFEVLDIPLIAGRGISEQDRAGAPRVVVINAALAKQLAERFELTDPVGKMVWMSTPNYLNSDGSSEAVEIVGVVRNERTGPLNENEEGVSYVPLAQVPRLEVKLVVRTEKEPTAVLPGIREAVRQIDPNLPLGDVRTMEQIHERSLTGAKQPAWVIGAFAVVAALLAALGIYGVLSHAVTQQRREIGIRMALGARSQDVLSHVMRGALSMVVVGLALGLLGVAALTRVIESLLFEVSAADPVAVGLACLAMGLVGLLAALAPASRAARVEPMAVLREDA